MEEVESINLRAVDRLLTNKKELELDCSDIAGFAAEHTIDETLDVLDVCLKAAVRRIEKAETQPEDAGLSREKRFLMEDGYFRPYIECLGVKLRRWCWQSGARVQNDKFYKID